MTEHTSTYGIIGYPLQHSLSPLMHNTAFKALGVDAVYKTFPLQEAELPSFFTHLKEKKSPVFGLNVTVPYKEKVLPFLDALSPFTIRVGAVNTIVIDEDRKLTGFNTDGPGFLTHLMEMGISTAGKRIAVLGAGGTTRAVLAALCLLPEKPAAIKIYNRTTAKARELVARLGEKIDTGLVEVVDQMDDLNVELADLLVNTTSVGLKEGDPCLVDENLLHANMLVYDVVYNPKETELLRRAKAKGARTSNGLGMLFYQGVLAFQHWAGVPLEADVKAKMRQSLEQERVI
ncbi:MAG: shikimate dehydrogenase [Candidatus Omnitrophota bacterium]|nr:shikimate dehydrogenase [Candidatus Omnitrophota bacterium]MDZ4242401.1 shikimate dehydrogenase [Candidatus Omnitrophota bacterium]